MKYYMILTIALMTSPTVFANSAGKREIVQELIQKLEATDPNIKSLQADWLKVREHLEQSGQQSESLAGLKLSVQHILDQWMGLRFRVLDESDVQYWALNDKTLTLPRAWMQAKGSRWVVQYSENPKLRRGDSFLQREFSPFAKNAQAASTWNLPTDKPMQVATESRSLSSWALDLTQAASKTLLVNNQKLCVEKVWFWLDKTVSQALSSKIENGLCMAILIDLRDTFGEGLDQWPNPKKGIPVAVLTNQGTREGAVVLAQSLKKNGKARVFGEATETARPFVKKEVLSKVSWSLVVIGDGGELIPDERIKDSALNAEGVDDVKETALAWLKTILVH